MFNEAEAFLEQQLEEDSVSSSGQKLDDDEIGVPAHTRSRGDRRPLPAELPRVEIVHTLDDDER